MCEASRFLPLLAIAAMVMSTTPQALAYDTAFAKGCAISVSGLSDDQLANYCACIDKQIEDSGVSQQVKDVGRLLISIVAMPRPHPKLSAEEMTLVGIMSPVTNGAINLCLVAAIQGKLSAGGAVLK
jgi:hypothetical protein